ncbi:MAG: GNAT family N-acetyltransferase [Betaproteobacteria bacterium]|nr:MAG: GNAT family N-acetyltransferase [Betaproteobacteria bacterium]
MQVTLRAANVEDARQIAAVLVASRRAFLPFAPLRHSDDQVEHWVRSALIPTGAVTVALVADAIVGVLAVSTKDEVLWLDQLYIYPTHVGQGIGSTLLAVALATNPACVRLYTFQENHRARRFYERHGFVAIALSDGSTNEERCPDVLYELARSAVGDQTSKVSPE